MECSWVNCSEGHSNSVSTINIRYIEHMKFAAYMAVSFIIFCHTLWVLFCIIVYIVVCFVCFCLIFVNNVFLLLCLCILIVMYVLF